MAPVTATRTLLGGRTRRRFLERYWQKRPLLVRGALPGFRDPLGPNELAGLACEEDVESRLVLERGGARPWQVIEGPQDPRRLRRLPRSHWTLLVQGANKHVPALAALLERFPFIPHWRVDDVMVSFAPRFGTVGPHVDGYDVFLVQGRGRRRWQIDAKAREDYRPGLDLRILRRFRAREEWVLETGDMLYLPPGVAHYGVALEDCFTYSVGFRAPSHADLVLGGLQEVASGVDRSRLYRDPDLKVQRHPGEISPRAIARMRAILETERARLRGRDLDRFVGELLTRPKGLALPPRGRPLTPAEVLRRARRTGGLRRSEASRIAFIRRSAGLVDLFADGRHWPLPRGLAFAGPLLSGARRLPFGTIERHLRKAGFAQLLADLVNARVLEMAGRPHSAGW